MSGEPEGGRQGGCLCGAIRYRIRAAPADAAFCHCRICQRSSGAPVLLWASLPEADLEILRGAPEIFASSPEGRRLFCGACGTQLFFRHARWPGQLDLTAASLDDPDAIRPRGHIHVGARRACMEGLAPDLPDCDDEPESFA